MTLTDLEQQRYARHLVMPEIGEAGQARLKNARVLIIGAGGLGAPAAMYLAAAGVGTLGIADADVVELSNLQRQLLHTDADLGRPKVDSALDTLTALNGALTVQTHYKLVTAENIAELIEPYDFVIDGSDNFETKFLINDACCAAGKPFCHAGVLRFGGQVMTVLPGNTPCYRCVFQAPPGAAVPAARDVGVVGAAAGLIGCVEALEAIKWILGAGELLTGRMFTFDALTLKTRVVPLPGRNAHCPACGD
ncbi:MAG: HesA/MoeB/ThiF family protein [Oscillospiraceae bacterium]|nr:HesA/MoeB/ThiF family protein [Oscillospiraceae bacterium]